MTKLFFATDIHGSVICWSKFLNAGKFYEAELLILGGDMTGKAVIPIVHQGGDNYKVTLLEQEFEITSDAEMQDMIKRIRSRGYYPYVTNPDELRSLEDKPEAIHEVFVAQVLKVVQQWMETNRLASNDTYRPDFQKPTTADNGILNFLPYTVSRWNDGRGSLVQEYWRVTGLEHAWSGGSAAGSYSDPRGPDATSAMWTFFTHHRGAGAAPTAPDS